ncbi:MAG: RHS repeat domain-containing protein [Gemmataceae bacterium]
MQVHSHWRCAKRRCCRRVEAAVTQTTDALGNLTTSTFDAAGNQTAVTDPLNHTTTYVYDELNRRTAIVDALGNHGL